MATIVIKASGIVRAAAYMAKMADTSRADVLRKSPLGFIIASTKRYSASKIVYRYFGMQ